MSPAPVAARPTPSTGALEDRKPFVGLRRKIAETVAPLLPSLQALVVNVDSTLQSVQERGSEIKDGFDKADSCERYR